MPIFWTDDTPPEEQGHVWLLREPTYDAILGVFDTPAKALAELTLLRKNSPVIGSTAWIDKRKVG